ncbi:hypothetical protein BpHYR1_032270 [Brachionus plicatilis]|uniref:Uncharacterized protein n=1 Tax=Brachionus plicatilis TaxID=10195 RepID=A0A3M7SNQ2_BRAPC|nr:hypothetical protein BpHYR1_032270 [Brachionus plicatilis]
MRSEPPKLSEIDTLTIAPSVQPSTSSIRPFTSSEQLLDALEQQPPSQEVSQPKKLIKMVVDIWNGLSTRALNAVSLNSFKAIIDRETAKALNGPGAILALVLRIIVSLCLRSCRPIFLIFIPSIIISPTLFSKSLNKAKVSELLPAPVLPTIPIFSPGIISALIFRRTNAESSRYFTLKLLKTTLPALGQVDGRIKSRLFHSAVIFASNSAPILTKKFNACDTVIEREIDKPTRPGLRLLRENTANKEARAAIKLAI